MRRLATTTAALMLLGLSFAACRGQATVVNACDQNADLCLPCTSDADCGFTGNPCTETVLCAHRDAAIATIELGCDEALEYAWPDDDECQCQGTCQHAAR